MKNERTVYTTRGCFLFILFSSCKRKNENGYNGSYFYFRFFVWGLEKRKRMHSYPFYIFYYEIEKRKTKGRYIHGPIIRQIFNTSLNAHVAVYGFKICILLTLILCVTYDIFELLRHKSLWDGPWMAKCQAMLIYHFKFYLGNPSVETKLHFNGISFRSVPIFEKSRRLFANKKA